MIYITFERGCPKFSNKQLERSLSTSPAAPSSESEMATMQHKIFCVRCIVTILFSTDAVARLCTRRAL